MALRTIRIEGDPLLRKKSRVVDIIDDRILALLDDMVETMYDASGVGLAAPQVGVLRRIAVVDTGDELLKLINPIIVDSEGEQIDPEACLSVPDFSGTVARPEKLVLHYLDETGEHRELTAEGFQARAICHELDHLDGILFVDKFIDEVEYHVKGDGVEEDVIAEE